MLVDLLPPWQYILSIEQSLIERLCLPISAPDVIEPAFRHAKEQLLRPFRFGQWTRLAFVGLLAGEMGSSGGCNFRYPLNTPNAPNVPYRGSHAFLDGFPAQLAQHA